MRRWKTLESAGPLGLAFLPLPASAAGSLDRLRAVSRHAQEKAGSVPEHLWVGVAVAALVIALIGAAAYWTLGRGNARSGRSPTP